MPWRPVKGESTRAECASVSVDCDLHVHGRYSVGLRVEEIDEEVAVEVAFRAELGVAGRRLPLVPEGGLLEVFIHERIR